MKRVLAFLTAIALLSQCFYLTDVSADQVQSSQNSLYEINVESDVWSTFTSHDQMVEAVTVDRSQLNCLTTEELVAAVLEYPLSVDILLYNTPREAVDSVRGQCLALDFLLQRSDVLETIENMNRGTVINGLNCPEVNKSIAGMVLDKIELYLLSSSDNTSREPLLRTTIVYTNVTVYTPKGTAVAALYATNDYTSTEKTAINNAAMSSYPNATFISTSTAKYNCHSYAWYSASTSNTRWINYPSAYMTDGSYTSTTTPAVGRKVYYPSGGHSAIIYSAGPSAKASVVTSKWGEGPLMRHTAGYCPYNSNSLSIWYRP